MVMVILVGYAEALDLGRDVESYRRLINRLADLNNQQRLEPLNLPDILPSGQVTISGLSSRKCSENLQPFSIQGFGLDVFLRRGIRPYVYKVNNKSNTLKKFIDN